MQSFAAFIAESPRSGIELDPTPPDDFTNREHEDNYFYHVTLRRHIKHILRFGLTPCKASTMADGFYRQYSHGKIFFSGRDGVSYWTEIITRHLEHELDGQPPKLAVVRFPKGLVKDYEKDELGSRDSGHASFFTTKPIKAV